MTQDESWKHFKISIFVFIIGIVTFFFMTFLKSLLLPIGLACFFAYLLVPMQEYIEKKFKTSQLTATLIVMTAISVLIASSVAGLIPIVKMEILAIVEIIPLAKVYLLSTILPWLMSISVRFGLPDTVFQELTADSISLGSQLGTASQALQNIFFRTQSIVSTFITGLLTPFFLFFLLLKYRSILSFGDSLVPKDLREPVMGFIFDANRTLRTILKRQLAVALILAVLYSFGFSIAGLKYSLAVGIIAGLCRMVPYLDLIVGLILSFVIIVTDPELAGWGVPIGVAIVIAAVQTLDGIFITPQVIGDKVGLHPAVVVASVIAFADWFGFVGVLIAIPVAAILKIFLVNVVTAFKKSRFYTGTPV